MQKRMNCRKRGKNPKNQVKAKYAEKEFLAIKQCTMLALLPEILLQHSYNCFKHSLISVLVDHLRIRIWRRLFIAPLYTLLSYSFQLFIFLSLEPICDLLNNRFRFMQKTRRILLCRRIRNIGRLPKNKILRLLRP